MTCKVCKDSLKKKRSDMEYWHDGNLVVVSNVERFECLNCGERIYSPEVAKKIIVKMKKKSVKKYLRVPVYS